MYSMYFCTSVDFGHGSFQGLIEGSAEVDYNLVPR